MVRKRILVSMRFFLIWRADSNDDSPGMPISISTMSGRSSRAFSTASPPSAASPITSKSLSLSSRRRTPWQNSVWSSTSKHLIFGMGESFSLIRPVSGIGRLRQRAFHDLRRLTRRHIYFDARAFPFGRDHARNPAQHCNPFLDSGQPKRLIARAGPRQAANIIRNYHPRFHTGVFGKILGFFADRGHQSQLLQHQRGKLANNSPDTFNGAIHHVDGLADLSAHVAPGNSRFHHAQVKTNHHQGLAGFVMQFAADAFALFFLHAQKMA